MATIQEILMMQWYGNSIQAYLTALGIFIASIIVLRIFKFFIIRKLKNLAKKTKTDIDDLMIEVFDNIKWPFYIYIGLYIALLFVAIPPLADKILFYILLVILTYYGIKAISGMLDFTSKIIIKRSKESDTSIIVFLTRLTKGILWLIAILLILSNLGYNVTSLIAGLGIGGIAIALALQNILGDLFASLSIFLDKPFKVGDFIIIGEHMGVVKKIGIKTSRIESLWGEEIVISNSELTSTRIRNFKRMNKRRIHFRVGVTYQTPSKKLRKIPTIAAEIFKEIKLANLARIHFKEFGDSALIFEVAYYVDSNDYNVYMDIQQEINFQLKERLEKEKIEFAYPTQTVFVKK